MARTGTGATAPPLCTTGSPPCASCTSRTARSSPCTSCAPVCSCTCRALWAPAAAPGWALGPGAAGLLKLTWALPRTLAAPCASPPPWGEKGDRARPGPSPLLAAEHRAACGAPESGAGLWLLVPGNEAWVLRPGPGRGTTAHLMGLAASASAPGWLWRPAERKASFADLARLRAEAGMNSSSEASPGVMEGDTLDACAAVLRGGDAGKERRILRGTSWSSALGISRGAAVGLRAGLGDETGWGAGEVEAGDLPDWQRPGDPMDLARLCVPRNLARVFPPRGFSPARSKGSCSLLWALPPGLSPSLPVCQFAWVPFQAEAWKGTSEWVPFQGSPPRAHSGVASAGGSRASPPSSSRYAPRSRDSTRLRSLAVRPCVREPTFQRHRGAVQWSCHTAGHCAVSLSSAGALGDAGAPGTDGPRSWCQLAFRASCLPRAAEVPGCSLSLGLLARLRSRGRML